MKSVARRVSDAAMLTLVKTCREMAVEEIDKRGNKRRTTVNKDSGKGTPQGARVSPLLANIPSTLREGELTPLDLSCTCLSAIFRASWMSCSLAFGSAMTFNALCMGRQWVAQFMA